MIDLEIFGAPDSLSVLPSRARVERLCALALDGVGAKGGHLAIELVDEQRIAELNERHRGKAGPTDVLSFPIDGVESSPHGSTGPTRELGDVVICPKQTHDLEEAILHGVLHLLGMDHETDDGEMLALQAELLSKARGA